MDLDTFFVSVERLLDRRLEGRPILIGGVSDRGVTILRGLADGDKVITRGASMVRDGDPVSAAAQ